LFEIGRIRRSVNALASPEEVPRSESSASRQTAHEKSRSSLERIVCLIEMAAYYAIVPVLAFLPSRIAYGVACVRGDGRYRIDGDARSEISNCVQAVLSDQLRDRETLFRIVRETFRVRSCESIDLMRLSIGRAVMLDRMVEIRGAENLRQTLSKGKGAILCSAHFGSHMCAFALLSAKFRPVTVVGRWAVKSETSKSGIEVSLRRIPQWALERNLKPNIEPRGDMRIAIQATRVLKANELIAICIDPPVLESDRKRALTTRFLNGKALLMPGVVNLAKLTGTPVLMTLMRRAPDWRHQVLEISPPVTMEGDVPTCFARCLSSVESAIWTNPSHWFYWKSSALRQMGLLRDQN
jgi:lauroyl/myristoyl acyltransferase